MLYIYIYTFIDRRSYLTLLVRSIDSLQDRASGEKTPGSEKTRNPVMDP